MKKIKVALIGEPNVGKSSILNAIGKFNLKVGNFSGTTVEKSEVSTIYRDNIIEFIDLPGVYSIANYSENENIVEKFLKSEKYDLIINIVDATNMQRNLNLTTDLLELKHKMLIAVNMVDEMEKDSFDYEKLSNMLSVDVVKVSAVKKIGLDTLLDSILKIYQSNYIPNRFNYPLELENEIKNIQTQIITNSDYLNRKSMKMALKYSGNYYLNNLDRFLAKKLIESDKKVLAIVSKMDFFENIQKEIETTQKKLIDKFDLDSISDIFIETKQNFANNLFVNCEKEFQTKKSLSDKIDAILIDKFLGIPIFLLFMWLLFELTFEIGSIPMDYIELGFEKISDLLKGCITNPDLQSLIIDGVIAGVSAVFMFLPNIIILFLGIALLESSGYMARVGFLLDGFLYRFGLHGKSIIPIITGFGCTVPAYIATKTLENRTDKLITMFILGFISCSAKLPVYVLFVGVFFDESIAGTVLFLIYLLGVLFALASAKFLRKTIFHGEFEPFIMELPKYRIPSLKLIYFIIYTKSISYIKKAGIYIVIISSLIWFASNYPKDEFLIKNYQNQIEQNIENESKLTNELNLKLLESSYLGQIGKSLEPIFEPLGFDWKMSISLVSGIAAKEIIVSTLSVLYAIEDNQNFKIKLKENIRFNEAISYLVFIALYLPCFASTIVFTKESGDYRYLFYLSFFVLTLSWISSFIVFTILEKI